MELARETELYEQAGSLSSTSLQYETQVPHLETLSEKFPPQTIMTSRTDRSAHSLSPSSDLSQNNLSTLSSLLPLSSNLTKLTHLVLMGNPVCEEEFYRAFLIWKVSRGMTRCDELEEKFQQAGQN